MLIDVHCHLDLVEKEGLKIEKIIEKCRKNKVGLIITQGVEKKSNRKVLEYASNYKEVKVALGFYPTHTTEVKKEEIDEEIEFIRKNAGKIVAIGEVGLDLKELKSLEIQKEAFEKFIALSIELDKPIIVHSRKAEEECIDILEKMKAKKVIMHCFSGKMSLAKRIRELGWSFTIPTSVKNSEHFQKIIADTDISQLLCETDSPYLHPDKGFPNEPANVVESYKKIAEIKKLSVKDVEKKIEDNFKRLFN